MNTKARGHEGKVNGFSCPCPLTQARKPEAYVPATYYLCCAGHFRHHYQIALGVTRYVKAMLSSILESGSGKPCRFVFKVMK